MNDVASRLANRVQLTSDGHKAYLEAVEGAFGADVDYAQLVKLYGASPDSTKGRYSPAECTGAINRGQARSKAYFYFVCRAQQSHDAHVDASFHAADECLFEESRKSRSCPVALFRQL
jgi:hypothetical protein